MSLVKEQSIFLLHVAALIKKASELGFLASGGELYRTAEQQALHVKNGRSMTMNSQHLKKLAIDINFFIPAPDGELKLTYDVEDLRPLGEFWEGLDGANRWGGNWNSFKDTPHFERQDSTVVRTQVVQPAMIRAVAASSVPSVNFANTTTSKGLIKGSVGPQCSNFRDDVESVQRLLNVGLLREDFHLSEGQLKPDGAFGPKTLSAIIAFQSTVPVGQSEVGKIDPVSKSMKSLLEYLPDYLDAELLSLIFLRSADDDVRRFCPEIVRVMKEHGINNFLRCAHFLAQIGHESGELRFREEIASGDAYEGRNGLGNTINGDGRKFKGRGLIQLTGRGNYSEYGRALNRENEFLDKPEIIAENDFLCVDVAGWYWERRGVNALADADNLTAITKKINGGLNGVDNRERLLVRAKSLLRI